MTSDSTQSQQGKTRAAVSSEIWDLLPGFLNRKQEEIETLKNALASGDFLAIKKTAHNIKGSAGTFGLPQVSQSALEMIGAAEAHDIERVSILLEQIKNGLLNVEFYPVETD